MDNKLQQGCEATRKVLSKRREGGKYQEDKRRGEKYGDNLKR